MKKDLAAVALLGGIGAIVLGAAGLAASNDWCGYYTDSSGQTILFYGLSKGKADALVDANEQYGPAGLDDQGRCGAPA